MQIYLCVSAKFIYFENDEGSYVSEKCHVFLSNGDTINFSELDPVS